MGPANSSGVGGGREIVSKGREVNRPWVVTNGTVINRFESPEVFENGAVAWQNDRIVAVGEASEICRQYPEAQVLDAAGGMILPGFVNLHHHFYSALARGLNPGVEMPDFCAVLDRLWWRLDRALDAETVALSAQLCAADCVRWGCTTVFDHHASPSYIEGSLESIAEAMDSAGLSAVLCYEVTDRNGHEEALRGLDENLRFIRQQAEHARIRGVVGLHASFTLRDATLAQVAERQSSAAGCHIHLAEDPMDVRASQEAFGKSPLERLASFGLLDERTLLAHGIHLEPGEYERIAEAGATLIHNPESNANNGVGRLDAEAASARGCQVGLGTDGMSSNVQRALRTAFLLQRHGLRDPGAGFTALPSLLANNARVAGRFLDEPDLGTLVPGAPADLVVIDAPPPTRLDGGNFFGHLVYGASEAPVRHTVAHGRAVLQDFRHTTVEPAALAERARRVADELWQRFRGLSWDTPYLG